MSKCYISYKSIMPPHTDFVSKSFAYTGNVQEFIIPTNGLYKLEVWGGKGGGNTDVGYYGGNGGYASGYKFLFENDILYICCGGSVSNYGSVLIYGTQAGGYNGGGSAYSDYDGSPGGYYYANNAGGGATHIAFNSNRGVLASYVNNQDEILIVAGGGGGAAVRRGSYNSGKAGGLTASGGSTFGKGQNGSGLNGGGGGGGGYIGGNSSSSGGNGGTNNIDKLPEITYRGITYSPSSEGGVQSGSGKATITLVTQIPTIYHKYMIAHKSE